MLNKLNEYAAKYADRLGFAIRFSVDLEKASRPFTTQIIRSDGLSVTYADLSGGEKQSVDICLAFAMHDLLSHKIPLNVLILDEVFEGLDREQIEAAFELIRLKAGNRTVFVITHAELIDSMGTKTITVEKRDNQTYVLG
jgi:DNA repair exonuclease SbcCD ATPase subunit